MIDLFGEEYLEKTALADRYLINPFTVINKLDPNYKKINLKYSRLPVLFSNGRCDISVNGTTTFNSVYSGKNNKGKKDPHLSVFDPALCEILMNWFVPKNGIILDPFAGGITRGLVACNNGLKYTGIDLRKEQIDSNYEEFEKTDIKIIPNWICGDSLIEIDKLENEYDCIFTCPPYHNLEKYSDLDNDVSNMDYNKFIEAYSNIFQKACKKTKENSFAVIVISDIRNINNKGNFTEYRNFVGRTIDIFNKNGFNLYNKGVIIGSIGSAGMRADRNFTYRKLTKIHEEFLVFFKGDMYKIRDMF